jgi:rubrerythrin
MLQEKQKTKKIENVMQRTFGEMSQFLAEAVHSEDFKKSMQEIAETFRDLEGKVTKIITSEREITKKEALAIRELIEEIKKDLSEALNGEKSDREMKHGEMMASMEYRLLEVEGKIPEMPKIPDHEERFSSLEDGLKNVPPQLMAEEIRDRLELLVDDERLDASAIKNLDKYIKQTESSIHGGGIVGRDIVKDYDLSPYLDGATKTFNIPAVWNIISVDCSSFPHALRKNIDYTYTTQTITFTSEIDAATTLATGQTVILTIISG